MSEIFSRKNLHSFAFTLLIFILFLCLCGCSANSMSADEQLKLLVAFVTSFAIQAKPKKWELKKDALDRHKGFFVFRRTKILIDQHPSWLNEPNQKSLIERLNLEVAAIEAYLKRRVGTQKTRGDLFGGTETKSPAHMDLADAARILTGQAATTVTAALQAGDKRSDTAARAFKYFNQRKEYVVNITWRAAGIHDEFWDVSDPAQPKLNDHFEQVLDRRLHIAERMSHNVSSAKALTGSGPNWSSLTGPKGPWADGFRVRFVEYPRFDAVKTITNFIGASHIQPASGSSTTDTTVPDVWKWGQAKHRVVYRVDGSDGINVRFVPPQDKDWEADNYDRKFKPVSGKTPAAAIDAVFGKTNKVEAAWLDWWKRVWLYCDHTLSALHIESLLFATRRQSTSGDPDKTFNDAAGTSGYAALGAFVGQRRTKYTGKTLLTDTDYFENGPTPLDDLEVGDHLIFWNSQIFGLISTEPWGLENALVMSVASDPFTGGVTVDPAEGYQFGLQGHGTKQRNYGPYTSVIAQELQTAIDDIKSELGGTSTQTVISWNGSPNRIVKWDPYKNFSNQPGAWWIQITSKEYEDWGFSDKKAAIVGLPKTVGQEGSAGSYKTLCAARSGSVGNPKWTLEETAVGTGYHSINENSSIDADSILFPLFEPKLPSGSAGWSPYFTARATRSLTGLKLGQVIADGSIMPGVYRNDRGGPIDVIKPMSGS